VRDILILPSTLSGADVIGVATPPEAGPAAAEAGGKGVPAGGPGKISPSGHGETAFSYTTRSHTKKAKVQVSVPGRVPLLFVQVCSALYMNKVPNGKVEDQMKKCAAQFAAGAGGAAAEEYARLEGELLAKGQIAHLSILSELPTSSYTYSKDEKRKYVQMRSEEVVDWGLFSQDLMGLLGQLKGQQAPAGEKGEPMEEA
jgi:hypothetical protein